MTVEEYGVNLDERLDALTERMKRKRYKPQPVRRISIPKPGKVGELRRLGIPTVEDKLVQIMLKKILENMYEADFLSCSYGFRPKLSCHSAITALDDTVMTKPINYLELLKTRLSEFNLTVSDEKTRVIKFGRQEWGLAEKQKRKVSSFNFLGFTHYATKSRRGKSIFGHKTARENFARKLRETTEWLKAVRNLVKLNDGCPILKANLTGHFNYFGISGNVCSINKFRHRVIHRALKWINRRSQKKSMTWDKYQRYLQKNPLREARICFSLYQFRGM